jgi:biopolymer transport protein ExbD
MRKMVHSVRPELNITSMLDVVLNLVFFFIVIADFTAAQRMPMEVPKFDNSLAQASTEQDKVVINVLPADQDIPVIRAAEEAGERPVVRAGKIVFGFDTFKPGETVEVTEGGQKTTEDRLTYLLQHEVKIDKKVVMSIRADRSIMYADFPPILEAIAKAGVTKINIVAIATAP